MHPRTRQSLHDVIAACIEIESRTDEVSVRSYRSDRDLQLMIERILMTVGEALSRAEKHDPLLVAALPNARNIIEMRNRIVHCDLALNREIFWTAAVRHAPILRSQTEEVLGEQEDVPERSEGIIGYVELAELKS